MIPLIETLEISLWLKFLVDATMKSFVIFAVAGLFGFILRRHSAAVRGLVWSLAIVGCLIVPLFSLTLPQWEVGVLPVTPERFEIDRLAENSQSATSPAPIVSRPLPSTAASSTQVTPTPIQPKSAASESDPPQLNMSRTGLGSLHWTDWMAACWAGGALFLLARLIVGIGAVWYISACSSHFKGSIPQVDPDWKRPVSVRQSDAVTVPMVWGLFRPVILFPADADSWQPQQQRAVLLHELAHIQRQDWLMQTMAQITCAVYWFNPLLWFAVRRMQAEAERACDDHVLNAGYQSTDYAQHLLDIVRNIRRAGNATRSAVAMARSSKIEGRLRTVLAEKRNRRPMTKAAVVLGLLALTSLAVPMGTMRLAEAVGPEQTLYQEIQEVDNFRLEPLPENTTEAEQTAQLEQLQQNLERGLQLCEQFLNTYLESDRYDEVFYKKLTYIYSLRRDAELEDGVEAFFSEHPDSKYAGKVRSLRAYNLENQSKLHEALAEWDKIDDPALLLEAYERKATIYAQMGNWEKADEFNLLRAVGPEQTLYAGKVRRLSAYNLEHQSKFAGALAEWAEIDDPGLLLEAYQRKETIYSQMGNWEKVAEVDLLRAEQILGKPAPEFSRTSVYGVPVSLKDLRGKVVVLYHWQEGITVENSETGWNISRLKQLHKTHGENPNFVLINICTESSEAKMKRFIEIHAMPGIPLLLEYETLPYQFGIDGWPHYVVIDKAGILRESEYAYVLKDLEIEHLVTALLAEDIDVPGERIIPRISQIRSQLYTSQGQKKKAITEYEKLLDFMPNNPGFMWEIRYRKFNLTMEQLDRKRPSTDDDMTAWRNQVYDQIVEASQLFPSLGGILIHRALELASFYSHQGDREKTWAWFQIALAHSDINNNPTINYNSVINHAKQAPESFAAIWDMPEFQKLMAETPLTEADKRLHEANRKREMYAEDFYAAFKSFVAVKADGEIFTGVILSQVGHILVPASVTKAAAVHVKIADYQPAKVVATDSKSGLAVVQVDGQTDLRPIVLGNVDALREYAPISLPNLENGYTYPSITVISTRGYPNHLNFPPEVHQEAVERPTEQRVSITQLEINDDRKVTALQAAGPDYEIIRGDAFVYHDGRLLAVSVDNEVRYNFWGRTANPLPIDQIRAALKRMNMINLMENQSKKPAK